jgi:hypothetical protein
MEDSGMTLGGLGRRAGHRDSFVSITRALLLVSITMSLIACGSTVASQRPASSPGAPTASSGPPVLGRDWGRAAVEGPKNFEETLPPSFHQDHPILRFPGQAIMSDVLGQESGGAVTIGSIPPDWTPAAWSSPDGLTWSLHLLGEEDFTFPVALAAGGDGQVVAVGRSRKVPVAWTSRDGSSWDRHDVAILGDGTEFERMTSVAAGPHGFVAGGSIGPEVGERRARFWTSTNAIDWEPVPEEATAFADAEVRAIEPFHGGYVAIGMLGPTNAPTGAVSWTSPDGLVWERHESVDFEGGTAAAVAPAPLGGLVVVGSTIDRHEAVTWTSQDGRAWTKAPGEASRQFGEGYIWMRDVVAIGDALIAVGDFQPLQRATGTVWTSRDGRRWERAPVVPVMEQVDLYAIASGGPGALAVGDFGGPDSHVPTAFFSPGR